MAKKVLLGLGVLIITVFGLAFFFDRYQTKPADQTLASGGGEIASDLHETQPGPGWEEVLGEDQKKAGEMGDIVPRDSPTPVIGNDDSDPVFDGLRLGGTSVVKGGTITVYVYAHDEESGLRDGDMRAVDGTGDLDVRAESHCNKISDDQLRCDLEIPQYATAGVWHVAYVNINDVAGRQLHVSFGESDYTFTVGL